ncbi:MAG: C1 family peptidase [Lactimicrobium sp.]|uniref:aminopeptidase C n=1 Tax=Lactimicrobium sp. TaxID=2563780 RepID=UPI002F357F1F
MEVLTKEKLNMLAKTINEQDHVLSVMAQHEDLMTLSLDQRKSAALHQAFNVEIEHHGITAQKQSGRCWMFSALNNLREITAEKMNVEQFEFSENYLAFYDKLEKANNWLDMAIDTAEQPLSSQAVQYLFKGIGDGNVWDQAAGLVTKYGLVPKEVMPETWASSHTKTADQLTNRILRKYGAEIRKAEKTERESIKAKAMKQIYRLQCILFGQPVNTFDYAWRDKDNNMHEEKGLTPFTFYEKYVGIDLSQYVHVICEPTSYEPMHVCIVSHDNGNMAENNRVRLNLEMDELENLCIAQLKAGQPVWIGLDAGAFIDRSEGILDPDSYVLSAAAGDIAMTKQDLLETGESSPNHNVLLLGVHLDENEKPVRWKIENSWGKDSGKDGIYACSEDYFKTYVFEAAIHKDFLSEEQKGYLDKKPVVLMPWQLPWM